MKHSHKLGLLAMLVFSQLAVGQQVGSLDLTTAFHRDRLLQPEGVGSGSCGWASHAHYPEVAVSLTSLDRTQYSIGDDVIFEVKIQNAGDESVVLPWTGDIADFESADSTVSYSYRQGTVSLRFADGERGFLIFSRFYAASERPETLKELRPGEWVLIQGHAQLRTSDEWVFQKLRKDAFIDAQVRADLMLNKVTFQSKGKNGMPTEDSSCINVRTQSLNGPHITLFSPTTLD